MVSKVYVNRKEMLLVFLFISYLTFLNVHIAHLVTICTLYIHVATFIFYKGILNISLVL